MQGRREDFFQARTAVDFSRGDQKSAFQGGGATEAKFHFTISKLCEQRLSEKKNV